MTAKFVITAAGTAVANAAGPNGPYINIVSFKVGSSNAPATTLNNGLPGLHGLELYSGVAVSYSFETGAVKIRFEIPAEVGPFEFGELGIFLQDGTMYARVAFPSLQQKLSSTLSGTPSVFRFSAYLKLAQAPALFSIQTTSQNQVLEVSSFSTLGTPTSINGAPNQVLVGELSPFDEKIPVWKTSDTRWGVGKYNRIGQAVVEVGSSNSQVKASFFNGLLSSAARVFLVQDSVGNIRGVQSIVLDTADLSSALPYSPSLGEVLDVYQADSPGFVVPQVNNVEYNRLAGVLNSFSGPVFGTSELDCGGLGQTPLPILTPSSGVPTQLEWDTLVSRTLSLASLLKIPVNPDILGFNSDWNLAFVQRTREYQTLSSLVDRIANPGPIPNNLRVPMESQVLLGHTTVNRVTPWTQLTLEADFIWATDEDAKVFFNAGGWTGFKTNITPDNYVQGVQEVLFTQLSYIALKAASTTSTGPMKLEFRYGDGDLTEPGNAGFYGLTNLYRRIFQHRTPSGVGGGGTRYDGLISITVSAKKQAPGQVRMKLEIVDTSGAAYSNVNNGGTLSATGVVASASADPSLLSSPSVPTPAVVVVGSGTSW